MPCSTRFVREIHFGIIVDPTLQPVCGATPTVQMSAVARCACLVQGGRRGGKCECQASRNHRDIESVCMQVLPDRFCVAQVLLSTAFNARVKLSRIDLCPCQVCRPMSAANAERPLSVFESNVCSMVAKSHLDDYRASLDLFSDCWPSDVSNNFDSSPTCRNVAIAARSISSSRLIRWRCSLWYAR